MKFNRFVFDNYLQTKDGKESSEFFTNFNGFITNESVEKIIDFLNKQYLQETSKDLTKRQLLNFITDISLILYMLHPDYFFPYFFVDHFFKLEAIFTEFNIPMPVIPSKVKHEERLY